MDAHQGCRVVRHDRHSRLDDRAAMAFVGEVPCSPTQQAGNEAFDHGSAVSTCVRKVYLGRGPDVVQVRFVQAPEDVLWRGDGGRGSTVLGIPTVRTPRSCNVSRKVVSFSARSPASEWMAGVGRVPTRAIACSTLSTKGST
jgi:hypothetical protein